MRPSDWDACTVEQEDALLGWLEAYLKAQKEANEKLKSGR